MKTRQSLSISALKRKDSIEPEWIISDKLISYEEAHDFMKKRVKEIREGTARECIWLLEHPPLYTAGTSAKAQDLLEPNRFPTYKTGRGGEYTYHGPGQKIAYVMLDLTKRKQDIRLFIAALEEWIIHTLGAFNIKGERREDRVGIWVKRPEKSLTREDKIAAIGIRVRQWITFHGISLNNDPDLSHYTGITPCGISEHGVTSLLDLGHIISSEELDQKLKQSFKKIF